MNSDKQIEEMAKDLCDIDCKGMKCNVCDSYGCEYRMQAEALYNAGYRKSTDLAEEIFAEIEVLIEKECIVITDECGRDGYAKHGVHYALAKLRKKHTEGEG